VVPPLLRAVFLLAAVLVPLAAQDELARKVNHVLDAARPALLAHLRDMTAHATRPGELALVSLAAIHDGVDPADKLMVEAARELAGMNTDQTYDLALRLMVMEVMPTFPERDKAARRDTAALLDNRAGGAFTYSTAGGEWDLSNTQYAALGLRSARALGVDIDRRVWARLAKEIGDQQDNYGGFGYREGSGRDNSYASMTAAGIAVLAICRQALGEEDRKNSPLSRQIDKGWLWFRRTPDVIGSPQERWSFYFHYGLERAAILCDVERIGELSWYERGALMLVDEQLASGGWRSRTDGYGALGRGARFGDFLSTSFAVLFLRRKFQKVAGPITPHVVTLPSIGPHSKPHDVEDCAQELVRRGMAAVPDVLRALRSEIANQRCSAAAALREIARQDFGYDPAKDVEQNREALKQAELWYLKNR
jgi:hypothetical protein